MILDDFICLARRLRRASPRCRRCSLFVIAADMTKRHHASPRRFLFSRQVAAGYSSRVKIPPQSPQARAAAYYGLKRDTSIGARGHFHAHRHATTLASRPATAASQYPIELTIVTAMMAIAPTYTFSKKNRHRRLRAHIIAHIQHRPPDIHT